VTVTLRASARALAVAAALAGALALAACTSSNADIGPTSTAPSSTQFTDVTPTPSETDSATETPSSTAPSSATPTPSKTATPPKPKPTGPPTCASTQLKIDALRGSPAAGQEFALITFTNKGPGVCTMVGFPGVSLRLRGALLGQPAQRSGAAPKPVLLATGAQAQAAITDYSSCQAGISDTVRVYAPDQRDFVDLPLALRGCRLVVEPVTHS
jgi:hypothetical protein